MKSFRIWKDRFKIPSGWSPGEGKGVGGRVAAGDDLGGCATGSTDRAREFTEVPLDTLQTMTAGDDVGTPGSSGRLASLIRALLRNAEVVEAYWPLALRYAMEQRVRQQFPSNDTKTASLRLQSHPCHSGSSGSSLAGSARRDGRLPRQRRTCLTPVLGPNRWSKRF